AIQTGAGSELLVAGDLTYKNFPSATAGTAVSPVTRLNVGVGGTLSLTADTGVPTVRVGAETPGSPWYPLFRVIEAGASGALVADTADYTALHHNTYTDASGTSRAVRAAGAVKAYLQAGTWNVQTAPSVAAGAAQT